MRRTMKEIKLVYVCNLFAFVFYYIKLIFKILFLNIRQIYFLYLLNNYNDLCYFKSLYYLYNIFIAKYDFCNDIY